LFAPMPHSLRLRCEEVGRVTANVGRAGKAAALAPARTARPCGRRAAEAGKTQAKGQTAPSIRTRRAKQPAKRSVSRACLPRWCEPYADSRQCQRRGSRQARRLPTWRCRHEEWTIARTPRLLEYLLPPASFYRAVAIEAASSGLYDHEERTFCRGSQAEGGREATRPKTS
jgi:hypothetical protein